MTDSNRGSKSNLPPRPNSNHARSSSPPVVDPDYEYGSDQHVRSRGTRRGSDGRSKAKAGPDSSHMLHASPIRGPSPSPSPPPPPHATVSGSSPDANHGQAPQSGGRWGRGGRGGLGSNPRDRSSAPYYLPPSGSAPSLNSLGFRVSPLTETERDLQWRLARMARSHKFATQRMKSKVAYEQSRASSSEQRAIEAELVVKQQRLSVAASGKLW